MAERTPRIPGYICRKLSVAALVSARLFDHERGARRGTVVIPDPCNSTWDVPEPVEVTRLSPDRAAVAIGLQVIPAKGRPGLNGRTFWEFECPDCRKPARELYSPVGAMPYRCRACWKIARPSRSPRWRGVSPQQVARSVLAALSEAGGSS